MDFERIQARDCWMESIKQQRQFRAPQHHGIDAGFCYQFLNNIQKPFLCFWFNKTVFQLLGYF